MVVLAAAVCGMPAPEHIHAGQVCNSKKVSDHHAIVPTISAGKVDTSSLPMGERELLKLVSRQLLCAVSSPYRYAETAVTILCGGFSFTAKGNTVLDIGWKSYMAQEQTDKALPDLSEGDTLSVMGIAVKEGKTTPPKHFTEDTLLSGMETAGQRDAAPDMRLRTQDDEPERRGLGTPATRAGIIEKLISTGFVERKKSKKAVQLIPARTGISLITVLPEQLQSPLLTAEWESRLKEVERGELSPEAFMGGITEMLRDLVKGYTAIKGAEVLFPSGREVVGKCPRCGGDVTESKKGFFCENNECRFGLWRDNQFLASKKVMLTKQLATAFLRDGRVKLTGLFSEKTGKTYNATVVLEDTGAGLRYKLVFDND